MKKKNYSYENYVVKTISENGKFIDYFPTRCVSDDAYHDCCDKNFYIAYKDIYNECHKKVKRELIGSWGNPIAYQTYLTKDFLNF